MLSRRLLISTCVLAFCATPALPQATSANNPATQMASSRTVSLSNLQTPPSMRAALRAWSLDRPTRIAQFTRGSVSEDQAQFSAFVLTDANGTRSTLDNLTITRDATPGPNMGTFTIRGEKLAEADGSRIGSFTLRGVRGGARLLPILGSMATRTTIANPTRASTQGRNASNRDESDIQADAISFTDISTSFNDKDGVTSARFGQAEITQVRFGSQNFAFDTITLGNGEFDNKTFTAKVAGMTLSGLSPDVLGDFATGNRKTNKPVDFLKLALGRLSFEGLTYSFKGQNSTPPPLNTLSIGRFGIENIKDGFIGQFSLAEVKLNGGIGDKAWEAGLNRFGVGGINIAYLIELGGAFDKAVGGAFTRTAANESTATPTSPPAAVIVQPEAPRSRILLKDLLKGGPLDSGINTFDMAGFKIGAGGYEFTIDQIGVVNTRNSDNIITKVDMIPSTLRLGRASGGDIKTDPLASVFEALRADNISLRFKGAATYQPQTDLMNVTDYEMEIVNVAKIKFDFGATGFGAMMSNLTMDDIMAAAAAGSKGQAGKPAAGRRSELASMIQIYRGVKINSARAEISDLGGIDLAARVFPGRSSSGRANTVVSAEQMAAVRQEWAQSSRASAGDKKAPAIMRSAAISVARWLENGGSLIVEANPPTPMAMTSLIDAGTPSPTAWGLRFSNSAPPRARVAPTTR
jgi:hypothetical protein